MYSRVVGHKNWKTLGYQIVSYPCITEKAQRSKLICHRSLEYFMAEVTPQVSHCPIRALLCAHGRVPCSDSGSALNKSAHTSL